MGDKTHKIIIHPSYARGVDAIKRALKTDMRGQIVFVVGLSGVGKSEIRYSTMRLRWGKSEKWGTGHLPAIAVRAMPSDRSRYSPKDFFSRIDLELLEPNLDWLRARDEVDDADQVHHLADARLKSPLWRVRRLNRTEHQIRVAVERLCLERRLCELYVEQAGTLVQTTRNVSPVDHMISCMCLAEEVGITLVMFGVPKMAALWNGSAEVRRRSRFVFVERYRLNNQSDRENFQRLAVTIARKYQFARSSLVESSLDLAYVSSVGVNRPGFLEGSRF